MCVLSPNSLDQGRNTLLNVCNVIMVCVCACACANPRNTFAHTRQPASLSCFPASRQGEGQGRATAEATPGGRLMHSSPPSPPFPSPPAATSQRGRAGSPGRPGATGRSRGGCGKWPGGRRGPCGRRCGGARLPGWAGVAFGWRRRGLGRPGPGAGAASPGDVQGPRGAADLPARGGRRPRR